MDSRNSNNVDYRLLNRLSNLVICSCCLRRGKVTPVPQLISERHPLVNECGECRHAKLSQTDYRRSLKNLLSMG